MTNFHQRYCYPGFSKVQCLGAKIDGERALVLGVVVGNTLETGILRLKDTNHLSSVVCTESLSRIKKVVCCCLSRACILAAKTERTIVRCLEMMPHRHFHSPLLWLQQSESLSAFLKMKDVCRTCHSHGRCSSKVYPLCAHACASCDHWNWRTVGRTHLLHTRKVSHL